MGIKEQNNETTFNRGELEMKKNQTIVNVLTAVVLCFGLVSSQAWAQSNDYPEDGNTETSGEPQDSAGGPQDSDGDVEGGSCEGFCGDKNEETGCWCDEYCIEAGDCCGDFEPICPDVFEEAVEVAENGPQAGQTPGPGDECDEDFEDEGKDLNDIDRDELEGKAQDLLEEYGCRLVVGKTSSKSSNSSALLIALVAGATLLINRRRRVIKK